MISLGYSLRYIPFAAMNNMIRWPLSLRNQSHKIHLIYLTLLFLVVLIMDVWYDCPRFEPNPPSPQMAFHQQPLGGSPLYETGERSRWLRNVAPRQTQRESLATYNCSQGGNPRCLSEPISLLQQPQKSSSMCTRDGPVDIFIFINSSPANRKLRRNIRNTWTLSKNRTDEAYVQYAFLLGKPTEFSNGMISRENRVHGDILQGDFIDSGENNTLKTMMAYTWFRQACPTARFVMKTDDDAFVNIIPLVRFAWRSMSVGHVVAGYCEETHKKTRNPSDPSFMAPDVYPDDLIPQYCRGNGYVMTANTARDVADIMPWLPILPLEDVFTGLAISRLPYSVDVLHKPFMFSQNAFEQRWVMFCKLATNGELFILHGIPEENAIRFFNECSLFTEDL